MRDVFSVQSGYLNLRIEIGSSIDHQNEIPGRQSSYISYYFPVECWKNKHHRKNEKQHHQGLNYSSCHEDIALDHRFHWILELLADKNPKYW